MYKTLAALVCLLGFSSTVQATITIEVDLGILRTATGAPLPDGSMLQLIASPVTTANPDGIFGAPTTNSFVSGNDILVQSFAMNDKFATGEAGGTISITLNTGTNPIVVGDALLLRWFSGTVSTASSPTAGSTYGQYRSDTAESNETGLTWFVPNADGKIFTFPTGLDFQTVTAGGSNLDIIGNALLPLAPAPEPSTYALIGCAIIGISLATRRRKLI